MSELSPSASASPELLENISSPTTNDNLVIEKKDLSSEKLESTNGDRSDSCFASTEIPDNSMATMFSMLEGETKVVVSNEVIFNF